MAMPPVIDGMHAVDLVTKQACTSGAGFPDPIDPSASSAPILPSVNDAALPDIASHKGLIGCGVGLPRVFLGGVCAKSHH